MALEAPPTPRVPAGRCPLSCLELSCCSNLDVYDVDISDDGGWSSGGGSTLGGSEAAPSSGAALVARGAADLGALCSSDFKVSVGAAGVCEEIAQFTAPTDVRELFWRMSHMDMFQSVEANTAKVGPHPPLLLFHNA